MMQSKNNDPSNGEVKFNSRRSPVLCLNAAVACSQPLAAEAGYKILKRGGNAADAAVAIAAALNVTEPMMTGLGGDCFVMFYDAKTKTVKGLNGSGKSPMQLTFDVLDNAGITKEKGHRCIPETSPHSINVPGAAAAWVDTVKHFGNQLLDLRTILEPAITLAETGFPVHDFTARLWEANCHKLSSYEVSYPENLLFDGKAPQHGDVMKNKDLANVFKELSNNGKAGFYEGKPAKDIINVVQANGGVLSLDDLREHQSQFVDPIYVDYHGIRIWEMPPNGQGIIALMALNLLNAFDLPAMGHNSSQYIHTLVESLRLSFADGLNTICDPNSSEIPVKNMLSNEYASKRRMLINRNSAMENCLPGISWFPSGSDTVYFSVVDDEGNACSFINSIFEGFGSGMVPKDCGFALQNRGTNFSLDPSHPNCIGPGKRSYHTIIPGMATFSESGDLYACFGVKGGFMQPPGHVQVLCNMIDFGMDPQRSLDEPRFRLDVNTSHHNDTKLNIVQLEEGLSKETVEELKAMGHTVIDNCHGFTRNSFGVGQIIQLRKDSHDRKVLWAGSDPRLDGCVYGY